MAKGRALARVGLIVGLAAFIAGWKAPAARAETITVTHWGGQFYGVPYAVAMEKGLFKKHGVDVTGILTAAGGGTAVRNTLGRRHSVRRGFAGGSGPGHQFRPEAHHYRRRRANRGRPDVGGQEGFNAHRHQGSRRQKDRLYRARFSQQHGDPDGAEGQRHHPAASQAGAGRRSRRQPLRRQQRCGRCRLLR